MSYQLTVQSYHNPNTIGTAIVKNGIRGYTVLRWYALSAALTLPPFTLPPLDAAGALVVGAAVLPAAGAVVVPVVVPPAAAWTFTTPFMEAKPVQWSDS
jgi:hypothetical protein